MRTKTETGEQKIDYYTEPLYFVGGDGNHAKAIVMKAVRYTEQLEDTRGPDEQNMPAEEHMTLVKIPTDVTYFSSMADATVGKSASHIYEQAKHELDIKRAELRAQIYG